MIRRVIWDFNGTLLDDARLCLECLNAMRRRRSMPEVPLEYYLENFDFPVIEFYRKIGFDFSVEPFDVPANEWAGLYHERIWAEGRLHEGAADVLETLRGKGIQQGILSAYKHEMLEKALVHFNIRDYFDPVLGLGDYHAGSKVELGASWIRSCGIEPEKIILIGDTVHDLETARAMGVGCALIARGYQAKHRLVRSGVPVLDDIREVPGFLER
ncbi:MAG: HAD family hydrolase [Elusimicrobia bacterium]|nr:HAD family hydrolase [Elusimicrobiota bacterium]